MGVDTPGFASSHTVSCRSGNKKTSPPGCVYIPYPAAGACFSTGKRRNSRGEIMSFRGEDYMVNTFVLPERRRGHRIFRHNSRDFIPPDSTGIISECDNAVVGVSLIRLLDDLHQALGHCLAVNNQPAPEKPVPGMF